MELGENLTCELHGTPFVRKYVEEVENDSSAPDRVVVIYESLETLARIGIPETSEETERLRGQTRTELLHEAVHSARDDHCPIQVKADCGDGV